MKKSTVWSILSIFMCLLLLLAACTPKVETSASPIAPTTPIVPTSAAKPASVSAEEAAWAQVVADAKKEGNVTVYAYSWVGDIGLAAKRTFEKRYNINLEVLTGRQAEFEERLKTERRIGQVLGDMSEGSCGNNNSMKMSGLLTSVADDLSTLREKDVWLVNPTFLDPMDKVNLGWRQTIDTPWVNTNLVKPDEYPRSWRDLLDPKWKGKMGIRDPRLSASISATFTALLDKKVWDEDYMRALHRQDLRYPLSTIDDVNMLSRGEINLSVIFSGATGGPAALEGAPIRAVSMKQGDSVSLACIAAIAKSPHPNATKVLLNWLLSNEGQEVMGKAESNLMVRKDVADFRPSPAITEMIDPTLMTSAYMDEGTRRFRERWYDKVVGR